MEVSYTPEEIVKKRRAVQEFWMEYFSDRKYNSLTPQDVHVLFTLYDHHFFQGNIRDGFAGEISFSVSKRMYRTAGQVACSRNYIFLEDEELTIKVTIASIFLENFYLVEREKRVCGVLARTDHEALLLLLEHEICHVILFILRIWEGEHGLMYTTLSENVFGHTSIVHDLPATWEVTKALLDLQAGDKVSFDYKGKVVTGYIHAVVKRAVVLVPSLFGRYQDRDGTQYDKYYVHPSALRKETQDKDWVIIK